MKIEVVLLLLITVFSSFSRQEAVNITLEAPENVIAGNDIKVVLTLNKGDLRDYSRFSQDLPLGFIATNLSSPNADFTFTDQRVRVIWLKLPAEPVLRVIYLISVNERLSGELDLGGTFAFVKDGERVYLDVPYVKKIKILPNPNIDPELVVDVSEFPDIIGETDLKPDKSMTDLKPPKQEDKYFARIIRQKPFVDAAGNITINILVKKPDNTDLLKIEEYIPRGYSFESQADNNATVSQSSSIARFVWMKVPKEDMFMISYLLKPIPGEKQEELIIEGNMTYTEDGKSKVESIREMNQNLTNLDNEQKMKLFNTGIITGSGLAKNNNDDETKKTTKVIGNASVPKTPESASASSVIKIQSTAVNKNYEGVYVKTRLKKIIKIEPLDKSDGIYFRVQVGAIKKPYFARVVYAEYDLLRDVKAEYIESWHKFTLGSFSSYDDASAFKSRILEETPTESAHIIAYKDGNRVPVSEVL